jgi:hypothetical protein
MTVVEETAGELVVVGTRARHLLDGAIVATAIVLVQAAWLAVLGYGAYLLLT